MTFSWILIHSPNNVYWEFVKGQAQWYVLMTRFKTSYFDSFPMKHAIEWRTNEQENANYGVC